MKTFKKQFIYLATAAVVTAAGLTSCSDFLEEYSQDLAKVTSWQDLDEVLLGDGYMHSARIMTDYPYSEGDTDGLNILHYMTDELCQNDDDYNDKLSVMQKMFPFYTWQQDTGVDEDMKYTGGDETYWNDLYSRINVCNMVIALIDEQPEYSTEDAVQKERVKGEAHFLRGLCYFFLTNFYAQPYDPSTAASTPGVPIKTSEYIEDIEYSRGTLEESYVQIVDDLGKAATFLKGKTVKSKYHGDEAAANLMLSRVYLYMQNWDLAIDYADKVLALNSNLLNLRSVSPGSNSVSISSPETIFSMGNYVIAVNFADDRWGDSKPAFTLSDYILNLYDRDDLRSTLYVGSTSDGYYQGAFLKYNLQYGNWGGLTDVSSYCLLRTPEAYLIKAEALAYKGEDGPACQVLDTFLSTRMSTAPSINLSGNALIDFIREERAREFILEGHRWFDLRRYTVCQPYPWSKAIEHVYYFFSGDYYNPIDHINMYRLEEYDQAYTLPIPRSIRQQQVSIGNNPRPARQAYPIALPDDGDDEEDW